MNQSECHHHKKNLLYYSDVESAGLPLPHSEEAPISVFASLPELVSSDNLFAETEERNNDDSNYNDSISGAISEWQSII